MICSNGWFGCVSGWSAIPVMADLGLAQGGGLIMLGDYDTCITINVIF